MKLKLKLILGSIITLYLPTAVVLAQFVEAPEVMAPANTPALQSKDQIGMIFDILVLVSALIFVISIFGFIMGTIKMVTAGGDELTAETASNMLTLSGWLFGASLISFLVINLVKYFVY